MNNYDFNIIDDDKRLDFLPNNFTSDYFASFENLIFSIADQYLYFVSRDRTEKRIYSGGYWNFLSNGNDGILVPDQPESMSYVLSSPGWNEDLISDNPVVVGIALTAFALNHFIGMLNNSYKDREAQDMYHKYHALCDLFQYLDDNDRAFVFKFLD